jgi:hypothetical protein
VWGGKESKVPHFGLAVSLKPGAGDPEKQTGKVRGLVTGPLLSSGLTLVLQAGLSASWARVFWGEKNCSVKMGRQDMCPGPGAVVVPGTGCWSLEGTPIRSVDCPGLSPRASGKGTSHLGSWGEGLREVGLQQPQGSLPCRPGPHSPLSPLPGLFPESWHLSPLVS